MIEIGYIGKKDNNDTCELFTSKKQTIGIEYFFCQFKKKKRKWIQISTHQTTFAICFSIKSYITQVFNALLEYM